MRTFTAVKDKVIGVLIEDFGLKKTASGLYLNDKDGSHESIKPRWFQVTHVGPDNKDFQVDDYVLVAHGRWSRGFTLDDETKTKYYHLDIEEILMISDKNPLQS
jgi:hypothetical protein